MKHPHAELMMQYAQDALTTDEPWQLWEFLHAKSETWRNLMKHPAWVTDLEYRRKLRTINLNGIEVPEPLREAPKDNIEYWVPALTLMCPTLSTYWVDTPLHFERLKRGLIHTTRSAALQHAKALISLTEK